MSWTTSASACIPRTEQSRCAGVLTVLTCAVTRVPSGGGTVVRRLRIIARTRVHARPKRLCCGVTPRVRTCTQGSEPVADKAAEINAIGTDGSGGVCATRQRREGWRRSWRKNFGGYLTGRRADCIGPDRGGVRLPIKKYKKNDSRAGHVAWEYQQR